MDIYANIISGEGTVYKRGSVPRKEANGVREAIESNWTIESYLDHGSIRRIAATKGGHAESTTRSTAGYIPSKACPSRPWLRCILESKDLLPYIRACPFSQAPSCSLWAHGYRLEVVVRWSISCISVCFKWTRTIVWQSSKAVRLAA